MINACRLQIAYVVFSVALSFVLPLGIVFQEDDEDDNDNRCQMVQLSEEKARAILLNRVSQIGDVLELDDSQLLKLRVASKGTLRAFSKLEAPQGPLESEFWKKKVGQILTDGQIQDLRENDLRLKSQQRFALDQFAQSADEENLETLALATLKTNLGITKMQSERMRPLLRDYIEDPAEGKSWLGFYQSNREQLHELLIESQVYFFEETDWLEREALESFANWTAVRCADCHVVNVD